MKTNSVSVVVPFYNNIDKLRPTLVSVFRQTHPPEQVIVVNDGSRESELRQLEDLQKEFGFVLLSQANQGPAAARNTGVAEAQSEYVAFIDADDLWHDSKLERQLDALKADPSAVMVICDSKTVDEDGTTLKENRFSTYRASPEGFMYAVLVNKIHSATSALFFRRDAAEKIGIMNKHLRFREDHAFIIKMFSQGTVLFLDEMLSFRVIHKGSYSHSGSSSYIDAKQKWDQAFFDDVRGSFSEDILKQAEASNLEHTAGNDIILGRSGAAIRSMVKLMWTHGKIIKPAKLVGAALVTIVYPSAFDRRDPALSQRRRVRQSS